MKQSKRKTNRRLVSKETIRQASYAKQKGLLAKSAKLSNNRLSRKVEKKIKSLAEAKAVPTYEFRPGAKHATVREAPSRIGVKVTKAQRTRAREAGLMISNGRLIIPKGGDYQAALNEGLTAGYRPQTEENSYAVDTILLSPEGIHNYADLKRSLESGKLDRYLQDGDRLFAFTIFGYHPRAGSVFLDGPDLVEYLNKYQFDDNEEAFQNFELLTLPYGTHLGPTPPEIVRYNRLRFAGKPGRREYIKQKGSKTKGRRESKSASELEEMNRVRVKRWRDKQKAKLGIKQYRLVEAKARSDRRKAK